MFLSDVIPLFGTDAEFLLKEIPSLLPQLNEAIRVKVPEMTEDDVQLLSTDIIATDFLTSTSSNAASRLLKFISVNLIFFLFSNYCNKITTTL